MAKQKGLFCDELCETNFRTDRRHRVIYPSTRIVFDDESARTVGVEIASLCFGNCAYCKARVRPELSGAEIREIVRNA